jgi:DNA-binding beta-propeller fold protein YncE
MNRRTFLLASASGFGGAWLTVLPGCETLDPQESAAGLAPGTYATGAEHLVFDAEGSAFLIDPRNHTVGRLDANDRVEASFGSLGDGAGDLNYPIDAVCGADGTVTVLDRGNGRVQVYTRDGQFVRGYSEAANRPSDIAVQGNETFVCDTLGHRVLVYDESGSLVRTIGELSSYGDHALSAPSGIAIDSQGELHIADGNDGRVKVYSRGGERLREYGRSVSDPGEMRAPRSITTTPWGLVYVADPMGGFVHVFQEDGTFVDRFRPVDERGDAVVPLRVVVTPEGGLYIWNDGLRQG